MIPLERVVFLEVIDLPGITPKPKEGEPAQSPIYPENGKIVGCYPRPSKLMARQHYNLWFDESLGVVIVEHPESHEREEVPFAAVKQWRRKVEKATPAAGAKK